MMGPYWHMGYNGMWITNGRGFVLEFLAWFLIAVLFIVLFARSLRSKGARGSVPTTLDILKIRYAKGEIPKEQFDNMKEHLK